ncbi:MAG: DUF1631 domain-containing protein [Pseudomonadota bacterium]
MNIQARETSQEWTNNFMDSCHEMALDHIKPHIQKMFENCNIALLEFAEKAQSNASQIRFMEAGTIIRKNRASIESIFYQELKQDFTHFKRLGNHATTTRQTDPSGTGDSKEQLTLISKEDTDIQVAIQNMVASTSLGSTQELTGIKQRLAVLNNGRKLRITQIPAGPEALARSFHKAIEELVLEHQSKLIIYLLFDKFVLSETCPMYEEYNERLLKAGLLQNLKYEARKNPNTPQPRRKTEQQAPQSPNNNPSAADDRSTSSGKSLGDELIDDIIGLMSRQNPDTGHTPTNPVPQIELVSAIHRVQQDSGKTDELDQTALTPAEVVAGNQTIDNMIANLSAEREQLFQGIDRRRLPSADTQMIDLVGMMFEYMLNDDGIPNVAKAELSRLHTPYLKVAIIDKTLFTDNSHPAHELLNSLARASARWVYEDNPDRGIFPCMRKIITRILHEFKDDLDIFTELLDILNTSLHGLDNKASVIEKYTRQAAEGKEKLELARLRADTEIKGTVSKHNVPGAIRKMLGDVWRDKLVFIYLREADADQSDIWELATQTIESILWCVEPCSTTEERAVLQKQHKEVYKQIRQSVDTLRAYGTSDTASELSLIRQHMEAAISTADLPAAPAIKDDEPAHTSTQQDNTAAIDQKKERSGSHNDVNELTPETKAAMAELDTVPFGTWFRIHKDAENTPLRAKLSWYSQLSGNYMFVNSMGIKVAVIKHRELANMLVSGEAEIMVEEQRPLVRRAMETIRHMLGSEQKTET